MNQHDLITVLVADTVYLHGASEIKNGLWAKLGAAITAYGGTIEQQRNGSLLGIFEPSSRKDDAERAIRAALALQTERQSLQLEKESQGNHDPIAQISIGINTGTRDVPSSIDLSEHKTDESAIALADYLQEQADPGSILISHNTYRYVRGIFNLLAIHPANSSNTTAHADYYLVQNAKPRAFHVVTRGVAGSETRLIGREYEYETLVSLFKASIRQQESQFITVLGEAGIGKSRLLYEFADYTDLSPNEYWLFKAVAKPPMRAVPLSLCREIFMFRADILRSDTAATAREKLLQLIQQFIHGKKGEEMAHFIGQLFGLNYPYSPYLRGIADDGQQIYARALHYICEFFVVVSQNDPLVILLEDLQWADSASLELITHLGSFNPHLRMIIVCAARFELLENVPTWGAGIPNHRFIELEPLGEKHSQILVGEILRKMNERPPELDEYIITGLDGNPLAIEERILLLRDWNILAQSQHQWKMEQNLLVRFPGNLPDLIRARLDALPDDEYLLLQQAAVIGFNFWDKALAHLEAEADSPVRNLSETLLKLRRRDMIVPVEHSMFSATEEYRFKHSLIQEVLLSQVGAWEYMHAKAAMWRVTHSGQRVREYAGLIAYHYEQAGENTQAMEYWLRAGTQALAIAAYDEARFFFERALASISEYESASRQASIVQHLGEVYWHLHRYQEARDTLSDGLRLARKIGDQQVIADSLHSLGRVALAQQLFDEAAAYFEESLQLAQEIGDRKGMAKTLAQLGNLAMQQDRLDDAQSYFDQCLNIYQSLSHVHEVVKLFDKLSEIAFRQSDFIKTKGFAQVALAMAYDIGASPTMLRAIYRLALVEQAENNRERAATLANIVLNDPSCPTDLGQSSQKILQNSGINPLPHDNFELGPLVDKILNGAL